VQLMKLTANPTYRDVAHSTSDLRCWIL